MAPTATDGNSGGVAAALVALGQGLKLGRNGDGGATAPNPTNSGLEGILPDLEGKDAQEQVSTHGPDSSLCCQRTILTTIARHLKQSLGVSESYQGWRGESLTSKYRAPSTISRSNVEKLRA